ncbi:tape measure protein [Gardnerella sp. DNF01198P]|uniref:tape measure protein n=1 Tax=Gardnerella sp. DNF01198P TaxID=2749066 RepID=UPI003BAD3377
MAIKVATAFVEVVPKVRNMGSVLQKAFAGVDAGSLLGRKIANGVNGSLGKYVKIGATLAGIKVLGRKIAGIAGSVINMGNEWGRTTSMLKVAVGTSGDWQKALEATHKAANGIGIPIKDMVESASRLVQLAPKTIPDYKTSLKFSTLLQKNLIATGASGAETASVMRQVTQALGKGIVNGDELNSIMENSPMIAQMLAKHLNIDVGKLKEMGKEGKISGDALRDAIFENADKINKQFAMMPITADRAFTAIKNDWQMAANQTATKISEALGHGLASISSSGAIAALANSLKGIIPLATSVGNAIANIFNKLAPVFAKAFSPDSVEAFLKPLTALFDKISSMSVDQLVNGLKMLGFAGAMAFSGILKGADSFLSRIPIIGGALVKLKNGLVAIGGAAGKMAGSLLEASGAGLSKLGSGLQMIAKQIVRFDAGAPSIKAFVQAVSDVDFKKMGKDGKEFVEIIGEMENGTLNVRDSVMQLFRAMLEAQANGKKIPSVLLKAFGQLELEANASCNTIKARFADMVSGIQALSKYTSTIKLFDSKVTLEQAAEVRAIIANAVHSMTGIKIPDFLTQPIGSMVASAVNTLNRLGGAAQTVSNTISAAFSPIVAKVSAALAPLTNVMKTVGSGIKSGLSSAISDACAKIPILGRAVSVVGSALDGLKARGGAVFRAVSSAALKAAGGGIKMFGNAVKGVGSCLGAVGKAASALGINAAIISGVTAGFSAMMKLNPAQFASSVQNMATNVTNGIKNLAANIPQAAKALATAIPQIAQTVTQCAPQIINGLAQAFSQLAPVIMQQLPSLMSGVQQLFQSLVAQLPSIASWLTNGFASLFQGACQALPGILGGLSQALLAAIGGIAQALPQALPKMVAGLSSLFQGLAAQIPQIAQQLAQTMPQVVQGLSQGLIANLPQLMQGIVQMVTAIAQALPTLLPALLQGIVQLIAALVQQLPTLLVQLIAALPTILGNIVVALVNCLPVLLAGVGQLIGGIIAGLPQAIGALIGALPGILQAIWDAITGLLQAGWNSIGSIFQAGGAIIQGVWDALWNGVSSLFSSIWNGIKGAAQAVWNWLTSTLNSICQGISSAWNACWNGISSFFNSIWNGIKGFAQGVWNGIKNTLSGVLNGITGAWNACWNGIKSFFSNIWNGIKNGAKAGIDAVFHFVTGLKDKIFGFFKGAGQWLINAGKAILDGLLKGLKGAWDGICNFVGGIGSWIAQHKGPISYDKKLLIPAGNAIMQGFSKGLGGSWQGVQKQVAGFTKQSGDWFADANAIRLKTTVVPPDGGWDAQQNQLAKVAANYDVDASQHGLTKQDVYEAFGEVMSQGVTLKLNGRGGEVMAGVLAKPMNNELNRLAKLGR